MSILSILTENKLEICLILFLKHCLLGQAEIFQHLDAIINTKCYREAGINICTDCGFQTKHMTNMKNHIETKHMSDLSIQIPCLYCKSICPTRSAMRMHMKRQHSWQPVLTAFD